MDLGIERVISSPFLRAKQSIRPFLERSGLTVEIDQRLAERVLSGAPIDVWREKLECSFSELDLSFEGGESGREAAGRARSVMDEIPEDTSAALVTHGNLMALLIGQFDRQFGFEQWKCLTNPYVYRLVIQPEVNIKRTWEGD